jgi:chemotaxis protein MotB
MEAAPLPPAEDGQEPSLIWLTSFADLLALLLCFFIMVFAMSAPRNDAFRAIAASLSARLNPDRAEVPRAPQEAVRFARPRAVNLDYLSAIVAERVAASTILHTGRVDRLPDRIVLTVPGDRLFAGSSAALAPGGDIAALAQSLRLVANRVEAVVHLDARAAGQAGYADPWLFALARAGAVATAFGAAGYEAGVPVRATAAAPAGAVEIVIREGAGQ